MKPFSPKQKLQIAIGTLVLVAVLAGTGVWVANDVYVKRGENGFVRALAPLLPAAKVGSRTVTYKRFLETRDTVRTYMASDAAKQIGLAQPVNAEVEKNAFDRLVREAITSEAAEERGVKLDDAEVRDAFASVVESTSSSVPNVAEYLSKTFNWNEEQFRANVVRPALLEEKVMATFASSTADQSTKWDAYVSSRLTKPDVKIYLKF